MVHTPRDLSFFLGGGGGGSVTVTSVSFLPLPF